MNYYKKILDLFEKIGFNYYQTIDSNESDTGNEFLVITNDPSKCNSEIVIFLIEFIEENSSIDVVLSVRVPNEYEGSTEKRPINLFIPFLAEIVKYIKIFGLNYYFKVVLFNNNKKEGQEDS